MPSIIFHGSSVPRIDSSSGVSREKTLRTIERKTLAIIMLRSTNRSSTSRRRYLEKSSNKNAKWTFARHGVKCVRPRNSFPSTYSFLFESSFIFFLYKRENWIRSSRKVIYSYKIIGKRKPRKIYNHTSLFLSPFFNIFCERIETLLSYFEFEKQILIILC